MTATLLLALLLVVTFALWLTIHLVLCARLVGTLRPKALIALLLLPPSAPLAAYWGLKFGHKRLVIVWIACVATYTVAWLTLSQHT